MLPVFDEVLADIGDRQSIEMSLSTFSGHIANLVAILDAATDRSLVLVDEVASGTDPVEGSALAQALVARLARQARLTIVTTHYPELKEWASARDDAANAATGARPGDARAALPHRARPSRHVARAARPRSGWGSTRRSSRTRAATSRPSGCGSPTCSPRPRRPSARQADELEAAQAERADAARLARADGGAR